MGFLRGILIGLLILASGTAYAAPLADCEYATVAAAVAAAAEGATIECPAYTATWTQSLVITKAITLKGAGAGSTVITGQYNDSGPTYRGVIAYESPSSTDADGPGFRLTGFTIDNTGYTGRAVTVGTSIAAKSNGYIVRNVRLDNNTLTGRGTAYRAIQVTGIVYGVIDNNEINGSIDCEEGGGYTTYDLLVKDNPFGASDNIYIEDNTFNLTKSVVISSGDGSRYVVRYNTIVVTDDTVDAFDVHGNMAGPNATAMVVELYGNEITNTGRDGRLAYIHGGQTLAFANYVSDSTATEIQLDEFFNDGLFQYNNPPTTTVSQSGTTLTFSGGSIVSSDVTGMSARIVAGTGLGQDRAVASRISSTQFTVSTAFDPAPDNTTRIMMYYSSGAKSAASRIQHIRNSYFWNNRRSNGNLIDVDIIRDTFFTTDYVNDPNVIGENREFWQQRASFTGAVDTNCQYVNASGTVIDTCSAGGVGCGTLAARPATCTTGVGYWATDQSCANTTGLVGVGATAITGTLYKCTATNTWTAYYTPYEYPHPLRGEGGATYFDLTVTAPTNGTITTADGVINCGTGGMLCSYTYASTESAVISFTPDTGYRIVNSSGSCSGASGPQTIAMSEARTCAATFEKGMVLGTGNTLTLGTGNTITLQ